MEQWESIVERPLEQCHRSFEKILETASALLNTSAAQLAPFETEWLIQTLLYSPVELLATVSRRRGEEPWGKAVADALRLLARVADVCEHAHYEHIVDVCLLSYAPELRKLALACLASVARRSDAGARDAARHIRALEEAGQCRAPTALLVGALCEHHPAVVCDEVTRIWRGFLNMLDNTKNTDTVTKAVLEGILGLLKHFGDELPCSELLQFYEKLSNVYINTPGCQTACYSILASHASLFKERVSTDRALRMVLWGAAPESTLLSVYTVTAQCVTRTELVKILTTEVLPHTQSPSYQTKLAALRVLAATKTGSFGDLTQYVDVHALEYELRREKVSYADAETVLWCVEYNLPNSERLLQAAILFYDNLPPAVRKKIVTSGVLNSPPELKRAAIQFLIARSCEDEQARVWCDLFDEDGPAVPAVVRELADCLTVALEAVEDVQDLPPKLCALLRLSSLVPAAHASPLHACGPLLRGLRGAPHAAALTAAGTLLAGACGSDLFYKSIRIDRCRDEATLHAACLALTRAPDEVDIDPENMLCALQIIFTSDVEPKVHIEALRKFDHLLSSHTCLEVDTRHAMRAVEKLRALGDRTDREVRVLHREVTMFLGKHGDVDMNNNRDSWDDAIIVDLNKSLALTLPYQGASFKVDLKSVLLVSLQHEDPSALQTFLAMLCANLSSSKQLSTVRAVLRAVCALARAHACGGQHAAHAQRAVRLCGEGAPDLLHYISNSKSCGARKLLAAALSTLCEEPGVLQATAERACVMLASGDCTTKRAGLDIAETLLASLENNHSLSKTILPELTILIAKTYETDTKAIFDMASKSFIDKKELFDEETIRKTVDSLLENLLKTNVLDVKIYKVTVESTIEFVKNLRNVKLEKLLDTIFGIDINVDVKMLYVLAVLKREFGFDSDVSRKVLGRNNLAVINSLFELKCDDTEPEFFKMEVVLEFLERYCEVILELKYKETLQFMSDLIAKFTPALVKQLHKNIKLCFTSMNQHWKTIPKTIHSSVQDWVEKLPIKKITESIERETFLTEHHLTVEALKIMSNVFDLKQMSLSNVKVYMSKWPNALLKLYSSGRLEEYFFEELSYFNDILTVSLRFSTLEDVKKILKNGALFIGVFIEGFFEVLTEKPFILLGEELKVCSVLLNDIVRLVVKKTCLTDRCENVLELVDKLWPIYEQQATFVQKHCLLSNLQSLGPGPESNPLQWATGVVCSQEAALDERVKLLSFVPDECFKRGSVSVSAAALCPARLRELSPALLEAAAWKPEALLPTIAALAANDSSTGWWDVALEACLATVAKKNSLELCVTLFHKCHSEKACERILVPLLRHSSTEICERFLASVLDQVLGSLRKTPKGDTVHLGYKKRFEEYMISLHMLLVAFEKLPTSSLESPSSVLYGGGPVPPWHVVREACKWCHTLRGSRCSDQQTYRKLQCMLYKCMCAAICRRRPPLPLYQQLLSTEAFNNIVQEEDYVLPIRPSWTQRNKSLPVAVPLEPSTLSPSQTQRSRIFLRTLSEDPMLFDLHSTEEEVMEVQDISLRETPLNGHECAATLTALFRHISSVPTLASLWPTLACLLKDAGNNLKWLLTQIICNCKEELKPQASVLLPGLLAVLASIEEGKSMNGLHVDVLDTILYWNEPASDDLTCITHCLITACMENRRRNVFDGLLRTLHGWLQLYGTVQVQWTSFQKYYEDQQQDTQKALFKVVKTILQTKIYIPQVLSKTMAKLDTNPPKLSECFGLAMATCQDPVEKGQALGEFKKYLEKCSVITNYVRVLYYASAGAAECCGEQEFRKIADYVTKVTSSDRTKCLHILSVYLTRGHRSGYVTDMFDTVHLAEMIDKDHTALLLVKNGLPLMSPALRRRCVALVSALTVTPAAGKVRRLAVEIMLQAYEEFLSQPAQPPAKRQKTESTPILSVSRDDVYSNSVLTCLGMYAVDSDAEVARAAREGLGAKLDKELGARFAECFLLTLYLPTHTNKPLDLCVCASALVEMVFSGVRAAEGFKDLRLRDEPLPDIQEPDSRLLTLSRTFQGTFRSYSATTRRTRRPHTSDANNPVIDIQMPIDSILETLLDFAKTTPEAARSLLTEVLRSILSNSQFDVASTLVPLLGTLLNKPTELTPLYIDVGRLLLGSSVQSLLAPVERLRALTAGTEGAELAQLLYEDVAMRCKGDGIFQLGQPDDDQDVVMDETMAFSIEDLKSAFGKLSNWEDLTLQQQRAVRTSLPPLWTERRDFVTHLDSYQVPKNTECWFDKMAAAFKQETGDSWSWLRRAERWPRRHFHISAITEALSWRHEPSEAPPPPLLKPTTCLAEVAARLMIRSSYYNSLQHSETDDRISKLSRSHELEWCVRANEMGIPNAVLQCVERNVEQLDGDETLAWLRQKLLALRQVALALARADAGLLRDVLKKAEKYTPEFCSDPAVSIEMYHLMLQLHTDLKSLSQHNLQTILTEVDRSAQQVDWKTCSKQAVSSVLQAAMAHYDEALEMGSMDAESAVAAMTRVAGRAAALRVRVADLLLAVLLHALAGFRGQLTETQHFIEKLAPILPTLDTFTLQLLEKNCTKVPGLRSVLCAQPRASAHKHRRCLQLVCDPGHLLTRYCEELVHAGRAQDAARWKSTLDRMRQKIFDNPYAGPSYKLLDKYKEDLYGMYEYEATPEFASRAEAKLKSIIISARRDPQGTLRLADLCPSLLEPLEGTGIEKLFGLEGVKVVKFFDKVQVFTDSIRRPAVLSMLVSTGHTRRAIHKTGEPLARDAAAQRVAARCARGSAYHVTLLDEESALIEYLEGHERLRTMIASTCHLDVLHAVGRPADGSLVQSAASLPAHRDLCNRVPAHALRSAMEQNSSCIQDFISKKQTFTDSLADMTLLTWLLGLGDRHLQNIMCSGQALVRSVDWGDVWRRAAEPPARLTRNMLAATNMQVLEARLQAGLAAMRGSAPLLEAGVRGAFHWLGPELDLQMAHVRGILRGTATSYDVTRDVTSRSNLKHKDKYVELLDRALAGPRSDRYSVEEQVSCLLRHCTSPELLAVARAGWEPWL